MKTMFKVPLSLLLLLVPSLAQTQDFTCTTNNGTITITKYTGPGGVVVVPSSINGYPVTSIESMAFQQNSSLTNVSIPSSVNIIGTEAFLSCTSLTEIDVDSGNSFYSSVDGVLFDKSQTTLVQYPEGKIGSYTILVSVTNIADYSFCYCGGLTSVTIGDGVKRIGDLAFYYCTNLIDVTTSSNVSSMGTFAFYNCSSLTHFTIPSSITAIAANTFSSCSSLTGIAIPASVTNIAQSAFNFCYKLSDITVNTQNSVYSSVEGVLVNKAQTAIIQYPGGGLAAYTIPNTVTNIGTYAFLACTNLIDIQIPNSVIEIADSAFIRCTGLGSIVIGQNVRSIGNFAFLYCSGLGSVTISDSVTNIGSYAFQNCSALTNIVIGSKVRTIGNYAFQNCNSLTSVTIPATVTRLVTYVFNPCTNLTRVYFKGNAPTTDSTVFANNSHVTVYYLPGTTGWGSTFAGRQTALWKPQMQTIMGSLGAETNQFGFIIAWSSGRSVVVEACTNLINPNWSPLSTNLLSNDSIHFSDPQWTNYPTRLYRLRSP